MSREVFIALIAMVYLSFSWIPHVNGQESYSQDVMLWNKLGSQSELEASEVGVNAVIKWGSSSIDYNPVMFDNGVRVNGSGISGSQVLFPMHSVSGERLGEKGAIALWVKPDHSSSYGGIARWLNSRNDHIDTFSVGIYWRGWEKQMRIEYFINNQYTAVNVTGMSFAAGDLIHVAAVWDRTGIEGSSDTFRGYLDGEDCGGTSDWWPVLDCMGDVIIGRCDYAQNATVDNLVIWNYAKTDFSDRFTESPLSDVHYVPDDFPTIQMAIDAAMDGDTVIVRPGTYVENIDFVGKAITVKSEMGPDVTTIDGNQTNRVVTFKNGENEYSVLEGFTITNGNAFCGGGINCKDNSSPLITNNTIEGNTADWDGGGINCHSDSSPMITNNTISGNTCDFGGGIHCHIDSSPMIANNIITGNTAYELGGGIYCRNSTPIITNNIVSCNRAKDGGGIYCWEGSFPTITNNIISGNTAFRGGGIFCWASSPTMSSNTITRNNAHYNGGGICCRFDSIPIITNTILWDNNATIGLEIYGSPSVTHCDVKGGWTGTGNIDADPLFVDAANDDYRLQQDPCQPGVINPCVDTGDPASPLIIGSTRTDGIADAGVVDMGYHYPVTTGDPIVDVKINGSDGYIEIPVGPDNATIDWNCIALDWEGTYCEVFLLLMRIENNCPVGVWSHVPGTPSYVNGIQPYFTGALSDMTSTVTFTAPPNVLKKVWFIVDNVPNGIPDTHCMIHDFVKFIAK